MVVFSIMDPTTNYLANVLQDDGDALLAIREIPVFRTSSDALLELIFRYGRIFSLREGEELTREGEFDQWVYFVIDGRLDVYLDGEWLDTIASSLVGERCILGEPRKATLRAAKGGTSALGVDMALLDALNDPAHPERGNLPVYLELLGRVVGEIIQRVAEMEFNRMDVAHKYATYLKSDRLTEIIDGLRQNQFQEEPGANFAIYRTLARHQPALLAKVRGNHAYKVDTRRLYALCLELGRPDVLYETANQVLAIGEEPAGGESRKEGNETGEFQIFLAAVGDCVKALHSQTRPADPPIAESVLGRFLSLNDDLEIDLRGLTGWLHSQYGYPEQELANVLLLVLQEASAYTAEVNARLKQMLLELSQIRFFKELGSAAESAEANVSEFFASAPPEDLIPFFSKNILDVHLIQPYLKKLGQNSGSERGASGAQLDIAGAGEGAAEGAEEDGAPDGGQGLADSLFD